MLTQDDIHDIKHALGLNGGRVQPFRNYYCAESDDDRMTRLVAAGMMIR